MSDWFVWFYHPEGCCPMCYWVLIVEAWTIYFCCVNLYWPSMVGVNLHQQQPTSWYHHHHQVCFTSQSKHEIYSWLQVCFGSDSVLTFTSVLFKCNIFPLLSFHWMIFQFRTHGSRILPLSDKHNFILICQISKYGCSGKHRGSGYDVKMAAFHKIHYTSLDSMISLIWLLCIFFTSHPPLMDPCQNKELEQCCSCWTWLTYSNNIQ